MLLRNFIRTARTDLTNLGGLMESAPPAAGSTTLVDVAL